MVGGDYFTCDDDYGFRYHDRDRSWTLKSFFWNGPSLAPHTHVHSANVSAKPRPRQLIGTALLLQLHAVAAAAAAAPLFLLLLLLRCCLPLLWLPLLLLSYFCCCCCCCCAAACR